MSVSASAITFGRCRGKGIGPVIGSGGGNASAAASLAESGAAGCCGATDGGSGKTLGGDAGVRAIELWQTLVHEDRTLPAVGLGLRPVGSPGCGSH